MSHKGLLNGTLFFPPSRYFCVVKNGPVAPLVLDLLGTGWNELGRPATLQIDNVSAFRRLQLDGVREYTYDTAGSPTGSPSNGGNGGANKAEEAFQMSPTVAENTMANSSAEFLSLPLEQMGITQGNGRDKTPMVRGNPQSPEGSPTNFAEGEHG